MPQNVPRRQFLQTCSAATVALSAAWGGTLLTRSTYAQADAPLRRVVVGVMGLNRGRALLQLFAAQPEVEVRYVCDTDEARVAAGIEALSASEATTASAAPQGVTDFRRILDDKEVDVLVCAAPNHWHAPATILACQAGKHVYVEKPCSHNPWEGEAMVQAARKHQRVVQLGTQRRSSPGTRLAIERLHAGAIGKVYLA